MRKFCSQRLVGRPRALAQSRVGPPATLLARGHQTISESARQRYPASTDLQHQASTDLQHQARSVDRGHGLASRSGRI